MTRAILAIAAALLLVAFLLIFAPILFIGALLLLLLAWKWPSAVERVTTDPRLAPVPATIRSTPMRFSASLVAFTFLLTATSLAIRPRTSEADEIGQVAASVAAPEADAPTSTPRPTPRPTERPTPEPTPEPTPMPTPEPTPVFGEEPTGPTEVGEVVEIIDGDTLDVRIGGEVVRVRLIGIDAPETRSGVEWMGPQATDALARLVDGKQVVLEKDVSETDQYGRALRYLWLEQSEGWLLVNLELLRLGVATVTTFPPDVKYADTLYLAAQDEAQSRGIGLWAATPTPVPTPVPTAAPIVPLVPQNCEPSYPDFCIAIGTADLDCGDIAWRRFRVLWNVANPDPHRFDGDADGIGCES